jgi:hypothetical protein
MAKHVLTLATLQELEGGKVDLLFRQALSRVVDDCKDRPNDRAMCRALAHIQQRVRDCLPADESVAPIYLGSPS